MAKNDKLVQDITPRSEDFAQWYTDVVKKAELTSYSPVRGAMILRPYGFAIWENIQKDLDRRFKETGHLNVAMPLLIPESLLQKEKDHVEGFAPEVAWVTHGGATELEERLCIRPTSEVLFCSHYAEIIQSYRDLPKLYNQWVSVVRWEKTTRPFLRTTEFYWQEGHTAHATAEEAQAETRRILQIYIDFYENVLAIPVIRGLKTDKEKFAGAEKTYTVEAMMHDGKALQGGTSHYFGDGFARAFDITYSDENNELKYVYQTSWGVSTRMIGGIIMVHGDDDGLILPPRIAPWQLVVVPIALQKPGVREANEKLVERLKANFRLTSDFSDKMPGWKFSEYEMRGVPLRLEYGPKDIEKGQVVAVRRDNREKIFLKIDENLEDNIQKILDQIHNDLYAKAEEELYSRIYEADDYETMSKLLTEKPGFVKTYWCGDVACEEKVKADLQASSRCLLEEEVPEDACCPICGSKAKYKIYWGKAY
ncbi:MAG: proline--tRNA ligase [Eubacteriales bacterium]|nr:proline--tRNA ligase [Eubacteriales bacterium]